jgi:hypothetical protein
MLRLDTTRGSAPVDLEKLRSFYKANRAEIVVRMREPTSPAENVAALLVSLVEGKRSLRREAARAVEEATRAREGQAALRQAMQTYSRLPTSQSQPTNG